MKLKVATFQQQLQPAKEVQQETAKKLSEQ